MADWFWDWAREREQWMAEGRDGEPKKIGFRSLLKKFGLGDCVYAEAGMPRQKAYAVCSRGACLFLVPGQETAKKREELGLEKSDENDVRILQRIEEARFKQLTPDSDEKLKDLQMHRLYERLTKLSVMNQNTLKALLKEYGKLPGNVGRAVDNTHIEAELKKIERYWRKRFTPELSIIKDKGITGVGIKLLGSLLSEADPRDFSSVHAYLGYLGLTSSKSYSRRCSSTMHNIVDCMRKAKDPTYYPMINRYKEQFDKEIPEKPEKGRKGKIDGKALNRVKTQFAADLWDMLNNHDGQENIK